LFYVNCRSVCCSNAKLWCYYTCVLTYETYYELQTRSLQRCTFNIFCPSHPSFPDIHRQMFTLSSSFLLNPPTVNNNMSSLSNLPYHKVIPIPALSLTMESGTIASWNVSEGDVFAAGDSLAEIETDKATMAFEAQDDGYVAKILVEAGQAELKVGQPRKCPSV